MNEYLQFKRMIQSHTEILERTIRGLSDPRLVSDSSRLRWLRALEVIQASDDDSLLRVAVVGSVKSGKSTLINTLLGADLLRRGAGIITAFITRVQTDGEMGGWVRLKSWGQALEEINTSLRLLPLDDDEQPSEYFLDIRNAKDRQGLQSSLERIQRDWQHDRGQVDPSFILLKAYLEGFGDIGHEVMDQSVLRRFDQNSLDLHQQYVGRECRAVYVRDMELHYPVEWLGAGVELADCQGSDSPNPLHLELLQRYLLQAHFIVYVISSRTGLREADFKLLDFLKTLRMFPQTLFVLNVDLDVHPHGEDLAQLAERVRKELQWVAPHPRVFAFSALYCLLGGAGEALPDRERRRLSHWRLESELVESTEGQFQAFRGDLVQRVSGQRARLLMGSRLSRLSMVAASVMDTANARERFLLEDLDHLERLSSQLQVTRKALSGTLETLENAISGLQDTVKARMDAAVDSTFDENSGTLLQETLSMVDQYPLDLSKGGDLTDFRRLAKLLHRFYVDFRRSVARFLVERVNLRVIEFAREQEAALREQLTESSRALWALFDAALEDYRREMARFDIEIHVSESGYRSSWQAEHRLSPPVFSAFPEHEALGQGALLMKFGLGRATRFLTELKSSIGKPVDFSRLKFRGRESVEEILNLVKSETKQELIQAFRHYGRSFKDHYLHAMLRDGACTLLEEFRARAEMTRLDFDSTLMRSELEGEDRKRLCDSLCLARSTAKSMLEELDHYRCAIQLEWLCHGEGASPPE